MMPIDIDIKCLKLASKAFQECSNEKSRWALFDWIRSRYMSPQSIYSAGQFLN